MMDQPSLRELLDAVREFLEKKAMPELKGHTAFHARVAANALAVASRQLEHGADAEREELARLQALLGQNGTLEELNRVLCHAIRSGNIDPCSPELQHHLEQTTRAKIKIDQPGYSGLRIAQERDSKP
jgi:hypothetical protein